jgi:hypothetical protein
MIADSHDLLQPPTLVKWITTVGQRADDPQQTLLTRHRAVIEEWARVRHAEPATGKGKLDVRDGGSGLRFEFPAMGRFRPISWDEWFSEFDEYGLVFVFREQTFSGQSSYEYRIVDQQRLRTAGIDAPSER